MLADLMTTEVYDGQSRACQAVPDPDWPAILQAFRSLDGTRSSWMTILQGEWQLSIGGGRSGYVVVAQTSDLEILRGLPADGPENHLELWVSGVHRPCPPQELHCQSSALTTLKAFVLGGQLSRQVRWQAA
jgi:hypothetical protein